MTTLVDATGAALALAAPPRRIVSLIPSTTVTLCALGLADALVGAGLPRKNPFAPLGFEAPAAIMKMGYEKEAKRVKDLAAKVAGRKDLAKAHAAAARAAKAAKAVTAALAKVPAAEAKRTAAITVRDGLAQPWETAWKALKNAARTAEDDGATGLFDALFVHKEAGTRTSGGGGAAGTPGSGTPPGSSPV